MVSRIKDQVELALKNAGLQPAPGEVHRVPAEQVEGGPGGSRVKVRSMEELVGWDDNYQRSSTATHSHSTPTTSSTATSMLQSNQSTRKKRRAVRCSTCLKEVDDVEAKRLDHASR